MSRFERSCKNLRYFVCLRKIAKFARLVIFRKRAAKRTLGIFHLVEHSIRSKQIKQGTQTRVTVLHTTGLYELYQTLD